MARAAPLLPFLLLLLQGCAARAPGPAATPPAAGLEWTVDSIASAPPLHRTSWGILAVDAATGRVLYSRNADKLFIPASNQKLVVSVTALGTLGPDFRYRTPILAAGQRGDTAAAVVLRGSGDPTWSARVHGSVDVVIDSIAALIAGSGLRHAGVLIADASLFNDELVHSAWEVGDLPYQYAPPIEALAAGEGVFRLVVEGGATPGDEATARATGALTQPIRADLVTDTAGAPRRLTIDYAARRDTVYITGTVGAAASDTVTLALTRPARSAAEGIAAALRRRGVSIDSVRVVRDSALLAPLLAGARPIAEWVSPPMSDIVAIILQPSQNWVAEQVLKTLGARLADDGSWRGGVGVERDYLHAVVGIDSGAVNLRDASGMSPQNLLTPQAVVDMLLHARVQPWAAQFRAALAAPGVAGSTLNSRLGPLRGRVAGKTGTISNVNSLSGFLTTADGREVAFAILTNGSGQPSAPVRNALDAIVLALAGHHDER